MKLCATVRSETERQNSSGTAWFFLRFKPMQYVIYFAVATPLLLGWLFYEAATLPPQPPLFASGYERITTEPANELAATPIRIPDTNKLAKIDTSSAN
jgi:hypothetical protein